MSKYGFCPLCQGVLQRERDGNNLACVNGDYVIPESEFNKTWENFPIGGKAEDLLRILIDANIKE